MLPLAKILGISSDTHVLWSDISHIAFGDDHHSATTANFLNIPRSVGMLHKHSVAIRLSLLHINCHLKVKRQCQAGFKQQGACIQKAYSILATPVFLSWILMKHVRYISWGLLHKSENNLLDPCDTSSSIKERRRPCPENPVLPKQPSLHGKRNPAPKD